MDLLITIIGNAAVDPIFRKKLLDNPVETVDHYGFTLTKGDFEVFQTMFVNIKQEEKMQLEQAFAGLEEKLYVNLRCGHPCTMSVNPPPKFRAEWRKAAA